MPMPLDTFMQDLLFNNFKCETYGAANASANSTVSSTSGQTQYYSMTVTFVPSTL